MQRLNFCWVVFPIDFFLTFLLVMRAVLLILTSIVVIVGCSLPHIFNYTQSIDFGRAFIFFKHDGCGGFPTLKRLSCMYRKVS